MVKKRVVTPLSGSGLEGASSPRHTVRERLQRHTHLLHAGLNQHPLLSGITRPGYSPGIYAKVLFAYHVFYRETEGALADSLHHLGLPFSYQERWRTRWIEADLLHFGLRPDDAGVQAVTLPGAPLDTVGQLVGTLYAIEGSSLGGQVILRHLAVNLGLKPDAGGRFFQGFGSETASRWREFCDIAEATCRDNDTLFQAEAAAAIVFRRIQSLLNQFHV